MALSLQLSHPKDLLSRLVPNGKLGGLVLAGRPPGELGTRCRLSVRFVEPIERQFDVSVQVAWARHVGSARLEEGYGVDFVTDDAPARDRLLGYARGEVAPEATRYEPRLAVQLPVTVDWEGHLRKEVLLDISQGGAFVHSPLEVPVGAELSLSIRPPRSLRALALRGRVAWIRTAGPSRGLGIEFLQQSARQSERIGKLLRELREMRKRD